MQKLRLREESTRVNAVFRLQGARPRCVYGAATPKLAARWDPPEACYMYLLSLSQVQIWGHRASHLLEEEGTWLDAGGQH